MDLALGSEKGQIDSLADSHLCEFEFSKTDLVVGGRREGGDRECKLSIGLPTTTCLKKLADGGKRLLRSRVLDFPPRSSTNEST